MKKLFLFALTSLFSCNNNTDKTIVSPLDSELNSSDIKYEYFISNGTWISTIDSLSEVDIMDDVWLFNTMERSPSQAITIKLLRLIWIWKIPLLVVI